MTPLEEARRWANRAEENHARADAAWNPQCRATWRMLAEQSELWAERALTQAVAFDAALRRGRTEEPEMLSKGGLHPYQAGLQFILRERHGGGWPPRDVGKVAGWLVVRMLADQFNKTNREVARDLINHAVALEHGQAAGMSPG